MALTKVAGDILDPGLSIAGVVTATAFDGPFRGGSGSDVTAGVGTFTQLDVNGPGDFTGIVTFSHTQDSTSASTGTIQVAGGVGIAKSVYIGGDLVVNGTTTTIDTTLKAVDRIEVADNSTNVAVAITQSGSGDIFNLYDGSTEVFSVADGGGATFVKGINVTSGIITATTDIHVGENIAHIDDTDTKIVFTDNQIDLQTGGSSRVYANNSALYVKSGFPLAFLASSGATPNIQSGGTNNQDLLFTTGTGNPTRMQITSGGNVGIGTTAAAKKLEVWDATQGVIRIRGGGAGSNSSRKADLSLFASGAREYVVRADASDAEFKIIDVSGSNAERFIINSSGEVDVPGGLIGRAVSDSFTLNNVNQPHYGLRLGVGSTVPVGMSGYYGIAFASNGSERVRITKAGNVGIGSTNPGFKLDVDYNNNAEDGIRILNRASGSTSTSMLRLGNDENINAAFLMLNSSGYGSVGGAYNLVLGHGLSRDIVFATGGTEKLRIDSSGRVGLGITNPGDYFSSYNRVVMGRTNDTGGMTIRSGSTSGGYISFAKGTSGNQAYRGIIAYQHNGDYFTFSTDVAERLRITGAGITVTGEVAASQDYPNYRPTLDLNFAAVKKLDPRITYTRTGPASFVNEFGKVVLVGGNAPRFDHDPVTRECKGLLIEESRTNDWAYSTDLSKVTSQGSFAGTQTFNTTTAPDGTTTADSHKGSGSSGRHSLYWEPQLYSSAQLDNSSVYTFSVFVKQITGNSAERYCELETAQHSTWTNAGGSPTFDLQNGTMDTGNASSGITGTIESYSDGWYRISMTSTTGTTTNDTGFYFNHTSSDGSSTHTLATTEGFHFWGAQIEKGSFITSYIPTSGSTGTRGLEVPTITGTDLNDIFNPTEGTMFYEASVTNLTNDNQPIVAFRDVSTGTASYHAMGHAIGGSVGNVRTWARDASSNNIHLTAHSGLVADSFYKHMYGYKYNDYSDAFSQGSTSAQTNTTSGDYSMLTAGLIDELRFGGYYSSPESTTYSLDAGHIKRFSYWRTKLSNTQIKTYVS